LRLLIGFDCEMRSIGFGGLSFVFSGVLRKIKNLKLFFYIDRQRDDFFWA